MGKILIIVGIVVLIIGLLIHYTQFNLNWFGKLPGDIRIEKPNFSVYIPVTSMILFSVVGSALLWLIRKINF